MAQKKPAPKHRMTRMNVPRGAGQSVPGLVLPLLEFDLPAEENRLRQEDAWGTTSRNGKTLAKYDDLRVVLISMKAGTRTQGHKTHGSLALICLTGKIRVHLSNTNVDLPATRLLTLERLLPHDVEAVEDSTFLLALAWPRDVAQNSSYDLAA